MKIINVEQFVTAVPHIPAIQKTRPTDYRDRPIAFIKVYTDEGIYGLGEGGRGQRFDDAMEGWIGQDPMALEWTTLGGAFGMAVYDIAGKALGLPAHKLMGTKHWDRVPVGWWSSPMEPAAFAEQAEIGAKMGFTTHKLKARPWNIVETVKLITKAAGPDYGIIIDPNMTFGTLHETVRIARELEGYNIQAYEDPFPYLPGWHTYRDLRSKIVAPVAPHLYDPKQIMGAIRAEAADAFNTGGTVEETIINAGIAEAAGMPVWLQVVGLGLGVSGAYATHLHSVVRNATIPSDSLHYTRENDLTFGKFAPKDGFVEVPDEPGLGVELDMDAVEKYRVG